MGGPSRTATRILGSLGATMACASLLEQEVRGAGWNLRTTPIAAACFTLALATAASGLRGASQRLAPTHVILIPLVVAERR